MKKTKKRTLSMVMAVAMLCGSATIMPPNTFGDSLSMTVSAAVTTYNDGDYEYSILDNGTVEIVKYKGNGSVLSIKSNLGGKNVTKIGDSAFSECVSLKSVSIPNGITSIGQNAFNNCSDLESITIPSTVTEINGNPFRGTRWLSNKQNINPLVVVNSILIDGSTCSETVSIPSGVIDIADYAFKDSELTSVSIPDSVKRIGNFSFSSTDLNGSVDIPDSVISIGSSAFSGSSGIKSINLPAHLKKINDNTFDGCSSLINVSIPDEVEIIGECAFKNCGLTSINIPSCGTVVNSNAFKGCSGLESVFIGKNATVDDSAFSGCHIVYASIDTNNIIKLGSNVENLSFLENVTSISDHYFSDSKNLKEVYIGDNVKFIGESSFMNCDQLEKVSIGNQVSSIGSFAFANCPKLTEITLPKTFNISADDFYDIFANSKSIKKINVDSNNPNICSINGIVYTKDKKTLLYCPPQKSSVTIPDGVETIDRHAFCNSAVSSVSFANSVSTIEEEAFYSCENLNEITIPRRVNYIGYHAFGFYLKQGNTGYSDEKIPGFKVFCYRNTSGEKYAKDNSFDYKVVDGSTSLSIVTQPKNTTALKAGDTITFKIDATGNGLKYEWYIKDVGGDWKKTGAVTNQYDINLTTARNGRQVFCKVIDSSGKFVRSNIAVGNIAGTVIVVEQPKDVTVWNAGDTANFTVKGAGHGLKYEWYVKDPGGNWIKTGAVESTYSISISKARNGRQVFCKIIDFKGRSVRTNVVKANIAGTVVIMEQPKNVTVAKAGDTATFTIKSVGHGMKYEWYVKDPKGNWTKTGATTNKYSVSITKARNGRQVFCKVIDFKNRSVRSNIVSAKIK